MKDLYNPKWIFIINTLPIIVLFTFCIREYNILHTALEPENKYLWKNFGVALFLIAVFNLIFGLASIYYRKKLGLLYGILSFVGSFAFILFYFNYERKFIPWGLPNWMVSDDLSIYTGTFLMPSLAYSFFIIVHSLTPNSKEQSALKNFLYAIAIPIAWFIFFQAIFPLWSKSFDSYHLFTILVSISIIAFVFFTIRLMLILSSRLADSKKNEHLLLKILLCIALPIICLALNNGEIASNYIVSEMIGNFSNNWFYILALLNGILLCLPDFEKTIFRFGVFIARSITYSFSLYFFIVFLPFLPFSILAFFAAGLGFLLLVPIILFFIHTKELQNDLAFLSASYQKKFLKSLLLACIFILPGVITLQNMQHRSTLHEALEYLYSPDYTKEYKIDVGSIKKTLSSVKRGKKRRNSNTLFSNSNTPYLSSYFNWFVLDRLTLSNEKIKLIEEVFLGKELETDQRINENIRVSPLKEVVIKDITIDSKYNASEKTWTSWINLELENLSNRSLREYETSFDLPEGSWINNYYLYVGDEKEMGMLTEKKSAMWIYSMIRNTRRDPGILHYLKGNKIAFKVYPFAAREIRKTGIQIIHKEAIELKIDDHTLELGNKDQIQNYNIENEHAYYLNPSEKRSLSLTKRSPYYHFVVPASDEESMQKQLDKIEFFRAKHEIQSHMSKITFGDRLSSHHSMDRNWQQHIKANEQKSGFYLDYGIKSILHHSYISNLEHYPVIIVVTDNFNQAILKDDFADWKFCFPDSDRFYVLQENLSLQHHSLLNDPKKAITENQAIHPSHSVRIFRTEDGGIRYLEDNNEASIILKKEQVNLQLENIKENDWDSGLSMQAKTMAETICPTASNKAWLNQVKASFKSNIMSPSTSYIVLETEAQRALLLKKQKDVLNGHKSLDLDEEQRRMSEPGFWVLLIFMWFLILIKEKKIDLLAIYKTGSNSKMQENIN